MIGLLVLIGILLLLFAVVAFSSLKTTSVEH